MEKALFYMLITLFCAGTTQAAQIPKKLKTSDQCIQTSEKIPQETAQNLQNIINENKLDTFKKLLQDEAFTVNGTGLAYSVKYNFPEISPSMYRYEVALTNEFTPLIFAASYAKADIAHELLAHGANPHKGITLKGVTYHPLYIALSENFSNTSDYPDVHRICQAFLKKNISREHFQQAVRFLNNEFERYSPEKAAIFREDFKPFPKTQLVKNLQLVRKAIEAYSTKTNQWQFAGIAPTIATKIEEYL